MIQYEIDKLTKQKALADFSGETARLNAQLAQLQAQLAILQAEKAIAAEQAGAGS